MKRSNAMGRCIGKITMKKEHDPRRQRDSAIFWLRELYNALDAKNLEHGKCLLCGEVFDDPKTMGRPCPMPTVADVLEELEGYRAKEKS